MFETRCIRINIMVNTTFESWNCQAIGIYATAAKNAPEDGTIDRTGKKIYTVAFVDAKAFAELFDRSFNNIKTIINNSNCFRCSDGSSSMARGSYLGM